MSHGRLFALLQFWHSIINNGHLGLVFHVKQSTVRAEQAQALTSKDKFHVEQR